MTRTTTVSGIRPDEAGPGEWIDINSHVAIEIGAVGEVRARDVHTIPTPRLGGLGMLMGFTVSTD